MPDPFRSREDLPEAEKKKREGSLPSANAHTHTKKSLVDTSDALAVNWGGERTSPSPLSRLPPNQTLKQRRKSFLSKSLSTRLGTNRAKDKFALVTHTTRVGLRFKTATTHKMAARARSWCVGDPRHMVDCSKRSADREPEENEMYGHLR